MNRRQLLGCLGAATVSVSGCLGPGVQKDAVVNAVPHSDPNTDAPVQYRTLPEPQQAIARTAVEDGLYHACPDLPEAVNAFANQFDGVDTAYLAYQGTTYGLWIRVTDQVFAMTASPPDTEPSCGLF